VIARIWPGVLRSQDADVGAWIVHRPGDEHDRARAQRVVEYIRWRIPAVRCDDSDTVALTHRPHE
jgi:hypothetical protein